MLLHSLCSNVSSASSRTSHENNSASRVRLSPRISYKEDYILCRVAKYSELCYILRVRNDAQRLGRQFSNLFIHILFLSSNSDYTASNAEMNDKLKRMQKEAVVAIFKLLLWHLREENHESLWQDSRSQSHDTKSRCP